MRTRYPLAVLLILVAAIVLSAALATSAMALPTFTSPGPTNAQGNVIGPCVACHTQAQVHAVAKHLPLVCTNCHPGGDTSQPPVPTACGACHGGVTQILVSQKHVTQTCNTTPGCHGVAAATTPAVTSFTPTSGAVGASVTITGTNFQGTSGVTFNGIAATSFTVDSVTTITAKVPVGATTGAIAVTTTGGTGTSTTNFTVTAVTTSKISLKLVGLKLGAIRLGKVLTAKGIVTPFHAGKVTITFQRKVATKWVKMKAVTRLSNATTGVYSYKYKPTRRGTWRVHSVLSKTASHTGAKTTWKTFKVK